MPTANVVNRYSEVVEVQFDAAFNPDSPYIWAPGEVKALPHDVALFVRRKSVVREDPITGKQVRALLVQGVDKEYEDHVAVGPGKALTPLLPHRGPELLDRANMDAKAQAVTFVPIANPVVAAVERESVTPTTHARRVL
jgi:hypothetical protein